jgi:tRNA pseudouridine55 synthase
MHGVLLASKPIRWTSFDVVKYVRNISGVRKVGHTGTLDPIAQGLLILCLGSSTHLVPLFMEREKEYVAVIRLGETTDTDDISGKLIRNKEVPPLHLTSIEKVLREFTGDLDQVPPMYSALKVRGKPLYKLAREGKVIEREPRKVHVSEITLLHYVPPLLGLRVVCGKGTYIRAIARDMGERLECGGCISSLVRTRIGEFRLSQATKPKSITNKEKLQSLLLDESIVSQGTDEFVVHGS